ncbi:MAG: PEGA domain-containing protein [Desulfobacterales bacterium]
MKIRYIIRDQHAQRTVAGDAFPIIIGSGPTADIRVDGLTTDTEAAYIGLSQNRLFVQTGQADVDLRYNHQKLEDSAWLMNGDILEIGACKISYGAEGNDFIIQVISAGSVAAPVGPPAVKAADTILTIQPRPFRPDRRQKGVGSIMRFQRFIGPAIGICLLLLFAAVWFVFTAKQITISVEPEPDRISIGGSLIAPRFGGYYLLRPGAYILYASKECYYPFKQPFEVGDAKSQTLRFQMEKLPGRLFLQAHQSGKPTVMLNGARVIIDGQEVGITPLSNLKVKAGLRALEIRADNYQDIKTELQITGCSEKQSVDFALVPGWSDVFISSIPQGAAVSIDGKTAGQTPLKIELPQGNYLLAIKAEGFKSWTTPLAVGLNQPLSIKDIRLQPADGILALQTQPPGANVTIDQKFVGQTPLKIQLSADIEHEIRISKAGYENVARSVQVSTDRLKALAVKLNPELGIIHFAVEPIDARLIVDGKDHGAVPEKIELVAVRHQLEIKKEGYQPYRTQITPRPGFPQEIKIILTRLETKPAGPPSVITAKNGYSLRLIRPQPFTMGSSRREQGRRANETLRKINLLRPFYMGVREVTNKEFSEFLASHNSGEYKGQRLSQDDQPVVQVTWQQAALFCNWLSAKESLPPAYIQKGNALVVTEPVAAGYRLPTEAEWEYCARITQNRALLKYPWGDLFPPVTASGNYADISAKDLLPVYIENYNDGYPVAAPVAKFKANSLQLYDMGGNVAEWCHDFYTIYTYNTTITDIDPTGPRQGKHHVVKGSSWESASITNLRLAFRDYSDDKRADLGFRICRYLQ